MTAVAVTCPSCGRSLVPGDRFCGGCGTKIAAPASPSTAAPSPGRLAPAPDPEVERRLAGHGPALPIGALLSGGGAFCRACGADAAGEPRCTRCGHDLRPLPARLDGRLGTTYAFRRGLRKRSAVVLAETPGGVRLLSESGEELELAAGELPDPVASPVSRDGLRTPHGTLLALAEAVRAGTIKQTWDAEALVAAALDAVDGDAAARLLALDAMALDRHDLLDRLPLTPEEQTWIRAADAAASGDAAATIEAIARLPERGYRPKLGLLLAARRAAGEGGIDLAPVSGHIAAYAAEEPVARLLLRAGLVSEEAGPPDVGAVVADARAILERAELPDDVAAQAGAIVAGLDGDDVGRPADTGLLGTHARLLLATRSLAGVVRPLDVEQAPLALLDDLADDGVVPVETILAGSADAERTRYLRGRLAPESLTDADVDGLEHVGEKARRAFRRADHETLTGLGDDAAVDHYRALAALRRKRAGSVVLDDVAPDARALAADLLALLEEPNGSAGLSSKLTDRVLADPTAWPVIVELAGSRALEVTPELCARHPVFGEWLSLFQAREHLFVGDWRAAVTAADRCLELAHAEAVRDEALNLKACALHYLGEDRLAIEALEQAIEGAYSESLLANIGIVAAGLEPEVAGRHLGRLIVEGPTVAMRTAAARRALEIWSASDKSRWRNTDESPLPDAFQEGLRRLMSDELDLEDFRSFAGLLAVHDGAWFSDPANIAGSPHRDTLEARFYVARARDLISMIEVMGKAFAAGSPPAWLVHERDSLREAALDIMFENVDEPDTLFGTVVLAMADHQVLATPDDDVLFACLGIASVAFHLSERGTEVADHIAARMLELRGRWQELDSGDRVRLEPIVELATRRVAINRMLARDQEIGQAIDTFNSAVELGSYADPGSPAYFEAMQRISGVARVVAAARTDLRPWLPLVDHEGVRDDLNQSIEKTREIEQRCLQILN